MIRSCEFRSCDGVLYFVDTNVLCRLKLGVYRNMGIDAERDEETGTHTRAIVRNAHTKDVHVFDVDGSAHETDQVWKSLPG